MHATQIWLRQAAACGLLLLAVTPTARAQPPQPLALTNVTVIDVVGGTRFPNRIVVVEGTRIAAVGASGDIVIPKGARVVDAQGRYLIPGLWDMHVHSAMAADVARLLFC